jgi:hypothetical protein
VLLRRVTASTGGASAQSGARAAEFPVQRPQSSLKYDKGGGAQEHLEPDFDRWYADLKKQVAIE